MISVYPPYQTATYQQCPMLWDLGKRWKEREGVPTTARLIGTAVAAGLEAHFKGSESPQDALTAVVEFQYQEGSDRSIEEVVTLSLKGLVLGQKTHFGHKSVLAVEQPFARCRPDLVLRMPDGSVAPVDHKVKINLDPRYFSNECRAYNTDTQMMHYSMAVGESYGQHVGVVLVHLIILGPRPKTIVHPVKISPERLDYWRSGAERAWQEMHSIEYNGARVVPNFTSCITKYGPCAYYEGCHNLDGDGSRFGAIYDAI